jgi:hypothetical protein
MLNFLAKKPSDEQQESCNNKNHRRNGIKRKKTDFNRIIATLKKAVIIKK